jgi:hypothetical protein
MLPSRMRLSSSDAGRGRVGIQLVEDVEAAQIPCDGLGDHLSGNAGECQSMPGKALCMVDALPLAANLWQSRRANIYMTAPCIVNPAVAQAGENTGHAGMPFGNQGLLFCVRPA